MSAARPKGRTRPTLNVVVTDSRGRPEAAPGLGRWLRRAAPRSAHGTVAIALVSDAAMRRLNRQYRGVDRPTDVLAFDGEPAASSGRLRGGGTSRRHLGDIVIARGVAARQARTFGHGPAVEWRILALHGLLHLLGYDHEGDQGQMQRLEERLRRRAGLPVGLSARGSATVR
ncbi:MAG TPA: rRNA maturation RNase YbeY [Vicinamibacterales bacterium]|nr:rRNA maturation RNase YbeY [Vicinamibacterales bacterium]